jgi:SPP1 family predicted phage head-tail adaptor
MTPGELKRRITFQTRATGRDGAGGVLDAWTDAFTVWAAIKPLSGRELIAAQTVNAEISHDVTVRWRTELDNPRAAAAYRITYGARVFNVLSVRDEKEGRQWVVCQCSEGLVQA